MLIRWLILNMCRSRAALRCVIRAVRAYLVAQYARASEQTPPLRFSNLFERATLQPRHRVKDARVRHSARLSMVYAILVVQAESPQLLAAAIVALPAALVMGTLYATGVLD